MKLNFKNERVLAVVAHPDDMELLCAGTLARAKAEGAAVASCVLCQGDKGQPSQTVRGLAAVRRKEMRTATKLLGAELFLGGHPDGELVDNRDSRTKLIEVFRSFRPTLVLAHAAADYHPDHRAASLLAEAASWFCASRGRKTKSPAMKSPPALWWMDTMNMIGFEPGFFVDVSAFSTLKLQLLMCHSSQLRRGQDADFAPLPDLLRVQMATRGTQAGVEAAEAFRAHHGFKRARAW